MKLREEHTTRSRSWGVKGVAQDATSAPGDALQRLVLREDDVIIAVDAAGRPCSLGSGAHGQVQPSRLSALAEYFKRVTASHRQY